MALVDVKQELTIDQEEDPNETKSSFDYTKYSGSEETGIGTGDADGFENSRRVIIYGIDPRAILPNE